LIERVENNNSTTNAGLNTLTEKATAVIREVGDQLPSLGAGVVVVASSTINSKHVLTDWRPSTSSPAGPAHSRPAHLLQPALVEPRSPK